MERSVIAEALLVGGTSLIGFRFVATTHTSTFEHDLLLADILAFSISCGILLMDLVDMTRHALARFIS